jgi:hypothetical protein
VKIAVIALLVIAGLYALHRLALWMERRGWIYYKKSGSSGTRTTAFLSVQALIEPDKQHIVEERIRRQDDADRTESGELP